MFRILDERHRDQYQGDYGFEFTDQFAKLRLVFFITKDIDIASICHKLSDVCSSKDVIVVNSDPESLSNTTFRGLLQMRCNTLRIENADEWSDVLPDLIEAVESERPLQSALSIIKRVCSLLVKIYMLNYKSSGPSIEAVYPELWNSFINSALDFDFKQFAETKDRRADEFVGYLRAVELAFLEDQQWGFSDNMNQFMNDLYKPHLELRAGRTTVATLDEDHGGLLATGRRAYEMSKALVQNLVDFRERLASVRHRLLAIQQEIRTLWDDELPSLMEL